MTSDHDARLERYADLAVKVGLNLRPGQRLLIIGPLANGGVSLESAPFVVARLHDASAGGGKLDETRAKLGLQSCVVERQRRGGANGFEQLWLVGERLVMDEGCNAPPVVLNGHDRPRALAVGERGRSPVGCDVPAAVVDPVEHLEGGIAKGVRERVPQLVWPGRVSKSEHQWGDGEP